MNSLLNQLNQEQLSIYKDLITEYNNGEVRDIGWYLYIRNKLVDIGVDENLAHNLAVSRNEFEDI